MDACINIERLVIMANRNEALMDGTTVAVEVILKSADLVYGVFNEPSSVNGVGSVLIKGRQTLKAIAAGNKTVPLHITAIKTLDRNMAIAARHQLGDGCDAVSVGFGRDSE